jgi:hypothetical protein
MVERRFQILKYIQKMPSMAICEACHLKFFVPMELVYEPPRAEEHLRQKYDDHKCSPILVGQIPHLIKK